MNAFMKKVYLLSLLIGLTAANAVNMDASKDKQNANDMVNSPRATLSANDRQKFAKDINGKTITFVILRKDSSFKTSNIIPIKSKHDRYGHQPTFQLNGESIYMYGGKITTKAQGSVLPSLPYFKTFVDKYLIIFNSVDDDTIYKYGKSRKVNIRKNLDLAKGASHTKKQIKLYDEVLTHYILTQAVVAEGSDNTCFTGNLVDEKNVPYNPFKLTNCKLKTPDSKKSFNVMTAVIDTQ
ncbi:MAG: hypothetical protein K0R14_2028 [Burkholderiales bacterium]|jgi:hypothetical protein|nr:hypothetical protein [Burkholderiales bacterium]